MFVSPGYREVANPHSFKMCSTRRFAKPKASLPRLRAYLKSFLVPSTFMMWSWSISPQSVKPRGQIRWSMLVLLTRFAIDLQSCLRPGNATTRRALLALMPAMAAARAAAEMALSMWRCNFSQMSTCAAQTATVSAFVKRSWKLNCRANRLPMCWSLRLARPWSFLLAILKSPPGSSRLSM